MILAPTPRAWRITAATVTERWKSFGGAPAEFCQSSESSRKSGRICAQNDVTRSSFLLIFTVLPKGSEGSRRSPGDRPGSLAKINAKSEYHFAPRSAVAGYPVPRSQVALGNATDLREVALRASAPLPVRSRCSARKPGQQVVRATSKTHQELTLSILARFC